MINNIVAILRKYENNYIIYYSRGRYGKTIYYFESKRGKKSKKINVEEYLVYLNYLFDLKKIRNNYAREYIKDFNEI